MADNARYSNEPINPSVASSKQSSLENMSNAGSSGETKTNRPYLQKGETFHWFKELVEARGGAGRTESSEERSNRLKQLREKQNEERQKKLEELKAQALAAQRFRETKVEERRRRIEESRLRENDRRQQVGERKRLICEAERDRRESILKKNMEREQRFELKRNGTRGSATCAFAFGSSTPRMLEPADTGGSFWGQRRATSTNNIMFAVSPLTRRSSERELPGSKKRATSAGGLDRAASEDMRMSSSMYEVFHWDEFAPNSSDTRSYCPQNNQKLSANNADGSSAMFSTSRGVAQVLGQSETLAAGCASGHVGRRRTDLMPTIPTRDSASAAARRPFTKSPGPSRPDSSLSQQSTSSVTSGVNMRSRPSTATRKPRPVSIAVTGVTHDSNKNTAGVESFKKPESSKPPLPRLSKSAHGKLTLDKAGKVAKPSPRTTPKATPLQSPSMPTATMSVVEIPSEAAPNTNTPKLEPEVDNSSNVSHNTNADSFQETPASPVVNVPVPTTADDATPPLAPAPALVPTPAPAATGTAATATATAVATAVPISNPAVPGTPSAVVAAESSGSEEQSGDMGEMTASMVAKVRITTEEEAKAALAERRRLAREEAERQAEAERLRIEEEIRLEQERQRQEEEQLRILAEEQRRVEEERLAQAIRETQRREEEERLKREEELKQKLEKEEQERKAREESEKQRIEMQERLKQEEKEREARRKRVEAIMLRTRAKGTFGSPSKDESDKSTMEESKTNKTNNKSTIESYETAVNEKEATLFNGSLKNTAAAQNDEKHSNGHRIDEFSKDDQNVIEHNVTNALLDIGDLDPYKNANTSLDLSTSKITNEDSVNSNNPADSHSTMNKSL